MVRQIFREASDTIRDGFRNTREEITKTFDNLSDSVKDTYHAIDKIYENPPHIKLALPSIQVSQNDCNTIININNNAFVSGLNLQFVHRNPYCTPPFKIPDFNPDAYDSCGQIFILLGFGYKLIGFIRDLITGVETPTRIPVGVSACFEAHRKCFPGLTFEQYLGYGDGTGFFRNFTIDDVEIKQDFYLPVRVNHDCIPLNPPFGRLSPPLFILNQTGITIYGNKPGIISTILSTFTTSDLIPEVLKIQPQNNSKACQYPPPPPSSPPPPPLEDCCRMGCCPNVEQNDQLLKLILKRIGEPKEVVIFDEDLERKGAQKSKKKPESLNDFLKLAVERTEIVSRIVGIENFPITVPDTMISPHKEGIFAKIFGFIDGAKKRKIHTIAEFIAWMSENDSAVLGEFHQVIELDTSEKDKKGKPIKSTVVLPNVAETLKELIILTSQFAKQGNIQTELLFKMAAELIATRASAHKSATIAADIQDYLDYPTRSTTGRITTNFKLPYIVQDSKGNFQVTEANENYREFLRQGDVQFVYDEWLGDASLNDQMLDVLQLVSMLRAIYYQRTDK